MLNNLQHLSFSKSQTSAVRLVHAWPTTSLLWPASGAGFVRAIMHSQQRALSTHPVSNTSSSGMNRSHQKEPDQRSGMMIPKTPAIQSRAPRQALHSMMTRRIKSLNARTYLHSLFPAQHMTCPDIYFGDVKRAGRDATRLEVCTENLAMHMSAGLPDLTPLSAVNSVPRTYETVDSPADGSSMAAQLTS